MPARPVLRSSRCWDGARARHRWTVTIVDSKMCVGSTRLPRNGVCRTARARAHTHVHTLTRTHARMHARAHTNRHTHTHTYIHTYTHARTHAPTHTRTSSTLGSEAPASCLCAPQWALIARVCVSQLLRFVLTHTHTPTHTQLLRSAWRRGLMPRRSVRRCCHRDQGQDCTTWAAGYEPRLRHRLR
jgi:hypothetical protein